MDLAGGQLIRLPDAVAAPRWLWIGPQERAAEVVGTKPALDPETWNWLEVASGVAMVRAATSGQFVPQMLNYELVGGVDFKKGCYPGQEVVARSHYLGKLKRRGYLLRSAEAAQPGQEVKIAATAEGSLHLGNLQAAAMRLQPLPYALPHESEAA